MDNTTLVEMVCNCYQCDNSLAEIVIKSAEKNGTIESLVKTAQVANERGKNQ